jgi:proline iminopeptidase
MISSDDKRGLYPAIEPMEFFHLKVSCAHEIYVERCGNSQGIPIVFLHGGPGGGCKPDHRRYFDPEIYNIILLDQRGSGRSLPHGKVEGNTTQLLVEDLESVRCHFEIDDWCLFGGSWGVTLALTYAQAHQHKVAGMILRGSFLGQDENVDWFFGNGANRFLPREWHEFLQTMNFNNYESIKDQLYNNIFSEDEALVRVTAKAWEKWSGAVVMFSLSSSGIDNSNSPVDSAIVKARLEFHYAKNQYFLTRNQLLLNAHTLLDIPTYIIHGARDLTCLPENAWNLHNALPSSNVEFLHNAGHLGSEADMIDALVRATESLANNLSLTR